MEENEVLADAASLEVVAEEKAQVAPETEAEVEAPEGAETDEDRRKAENLTAPGPRKDLQAEAA
jgi:hypothetical protein